MKIRWMDKVTTPEGFTGEVVEFGENGTCRVLFDIASSNPIGTWLEMEKWYKTEDLIVGHVTTT